MDPGLGGWWVGTAIGVVVVLVVAAVAITLILLARRLNAQAELAIDALDAAEHNTSPLWDVGTTNAEVMAILQGARMAREALEEGA